MPTSTLICGDCLAEMGKLAPGSVDLTVTSPPYDNLRTYNGTLNDWAPAKWRAIIAELYRVTKDGGVVVWVVGDATIKGSETGASFRQSLWARECGFRLHDTMIYHRDGPPQEHAPRYQPQFEFMFVWSKGRPETFNEIRVPAIHGGTSRAARTYRQRDGRLAATNGEPFQAATKRRGNIWKIDAGFNKSTKDRIAFEHPAIFPEALARDHILSWSNEGDTVLDPFLGSGTTGKMALLHGRNFIGIERDASYLAIAEKRIAPALAQAA